MTNWHDGRVLEPYDNDLTYDLIYMTQASTMTGKLVVSVQILTAHDSRDSKGSG